MTTTITEEVRVNHASGVNPREAKYLVIHLDDKEPVIGQLFSQTAARINEKAEFNQKLDNLSHQFLISLGMPIGKAINTIFQLISRTPATCQVGIVLDHDQDGYTGADIAKGILSGIRDRRELRQIKILGFTGRATDHDVAESWQGIGEVINKSAFDRDFIDTTIYILQKLFAKE